MRLRLTFTLVVLNALLFSYIYYLEKKGGETAIDSQIVFAPGVIEQVEEIGVSGPKLTHPWSAQREGEAWSVLKPVAWPANPYAIERLLNLLRQLKWETRFPVAELESAGRALEDYGLGPDAARLSLRTPQNELSLRIGSPTEIGNRLYLLSPDEKQVYVVQRTLVEGIDLRPRDLIEHRVFVIPPFEARSVYLQAGTNGSVRVELAREGDGWVLRAPIRVAASGEATSRALDSLYDVQLAGFSSAPPSDHGLASPYLRINLNGNNRQQTLLLGNVVDEGAVPRLRYAKLEAREAVFTVPEGPFAVWQTAQESLRQRRFMTFDPAEVSALQVTVGEQSLNLQRLESGRWQLLITSEDGTLRSVFADTALMEDLLQQLSALEALRFETDAPSVEDLARFGLSQPQRRLTVRLRSDRTLTLLLGDFVTEQLGDERTNRIYAKREDSPSVYVTPASILAASPLNPLHYRERIAHVLPGSARIERLRLREINLEAPLFDFSRPPTQSWEDVLADRPSETRDAALALLEAIRRFPVRKFIAESFTEPLRLDAQTELPWKYVVEAEIRIGGEALPEPLVQRYFLTERIGGLTQFAGSRSLDLVFTLAPPLIDALHPVLFDRPRPDAPVNPAPAETAPRVPIEDTPLPLPPLEEPTETPAP